MEQVEGIMDNSNTPLLQHSDPIPGKGEIPIGTASSRAEKRLLSFALHAVVLVSTYLHMLKDGYIIPSKLEPYHPPCPIDVRIAQAFRALSPSIHEFCEEFISSGRSA